MNIDRLNELKVNKEGFAFNSRTGDTYSINATGMLIMNGIKAGATNRKITGQMAERFDIDLQTACRDLERFIDQLDRNKLIETGGPA